MSFWWGDSEPAQFWFWTLEKSDSGEADSRYWSDEHPTGTFVNCSSAEVVQKGVVLVLVLALVLVMVMVLGIWFLLCFWFWFWLCFWFWFLLWFWLIF